MDIELSYEAIVANPHFSVKWSAKGICSAQCPPKGQHGNLAPKSNSSPNLCESENLITKRPHKPTLNSKGISVCGSLKKGQ